MRFTLTATALLLAPLVVQCSANAGEALLYLHPAQEATPAPLSPAQVNRILSYHLRVPGARMGADQQIEPKAWQWAKGQALTTAEDLFGAGEEKEVKRIVVVLDQEHRDLIPATLRHTHTIPSPPHRNSFDALLHSYAEKLGGLPGMVAGAVGDAFQSAAEWIAGEHRPKPETPSENLNKALHAIGEFVRSGRFAEAETPALSVARFDEALKDLKAAYEETDFYPQALTTITSALEAAASSAQERGDTLAVLVLPVDKEVATSTLGQLTRRDALAAFASVAERDAEQLKSDDGDHETKLPKEADYQGKCFTSANDLEKATNNCTGRGKAEESRIGGRKCFVCKCESKKTKGKTTHFAGAACQKVDVSGPFVLIATTVLVLILVTVGTIYYLAAEGDKELPNVLSGLTKSN